MWLAVVAVTTVPSPKSSNDVAIVPSGSDDPTDEAVTVTGAVPLTGVTVSVATGARLTTVIVAEFLRTAPLASQACATTRWVPVAIGSCTSTLLIAASQAG